MSRATAGIALCFVLGLSTAAYAGPCDNPYDRNPANNDHPTPACEDTRLAATATELVRADKAVADWEAAQAICRNLPNVAPSDPRAALCQQLRERDAAIAKSNDDARKAADVAILRRALAEHAL